LLLAPQFGQMIISISSLSDIARNYTQRQSSEKASQTVFSGQWSVVSWGANLLPNIRLILERILIPETDH